MSNTSNNFTHDISLSSAPVNWNHINIQSTFLPSQQTNNSNNVTVIKSMGNREPYDRTKIETAVGKAVGHNNKDVIKEIVNFVESKIDFTSPPPIINNLSSPSSYCPIIITTAYINTLVEACMQYKINKGNKKFSEYLSKYVSNKHKKQDETVMKVSHLYATIKNGGHITSLKKFTSNQTSIAASRYLLKDLETGEIKESIEEWFDRVASCIVLGSILHDHDIYDIENDHGYDSIYIYANAMEENELRQFKPKILQQYQIDIIIAFYNRNQNRMKWNRAQTLERIDSELWDKYAELKYRYKGLMLNGVFLPNTPTLMNSGSGSGGLSACFTLDVEDNMKSIAGGIWPSSAFIFKMAGGLGVNISQIRPSGSPVSDTHGAATGPINLVLEAIDKITDIVKSGGKRRGANMGIMEYWHPQILEFINYKTIPGKLENFNVSVMFDDDFWHHYFNDEEIILKHKDKIFGVIKAKELMDKIADNAWKSAEPGILFKDNMNKKNPLRSLYGDIHITNPCSEQAMYDGESCTLGSINLAKFVDDDDEDNIDDNSNSKKPSSFNFNDFQQIVRLTTRFLNDVLEVNKYPTDFIEEQSNKTRRIGLGIMGFADMLFKMRIRFNSQEAYDLISLISSSLYWESVGESKRLAFERGPCPAFLELKKAKESEDAKSIVDRIYNEKTFQSSEDVMMHINDVGVRNAWTTTIAPTGTISMIANCSNGLEPIFSLVYKKTVSAGDYYYLNEEFKNALIQEGIYNDEIIKRVEVNYGSCQGIEDIPEWIQNVFVTAIDLHWTDHIVSQAIWQQHIDNSISKTINLPHNAAPKDILKTYVLAHDLGLKGVSVYRDGCRDKQVMHTNTSVTSNNGSTIGVKAIVNETIQKNSEPSEATISYLRNNVKNEKILAELEETIFNKNVLQSQTQLYVKEKEECPYCKKGVMINTAGCVSCNLCGFSKSCAVG